MSRHTGIATPVASFDQSLPLAFYRWFRPIDRTKRLMSRSHPLKFRLRRNIRPGVSSVGQCAWASPAGRQLTNALSFSQPVSISVERRWPLPGEQGCRLVSSRHLRSAVSHCRQQAVRYRKKDVDSNHKTSHTLFPPAATNTTLRRIRQRKQHRIEFFKN